MRTTVFFPCIVCFFSLSASLAQGVEIGVMGGAMTYSGDLSRKERGLYLETAQPFGGAFVYFNARGKVQVGASMLIGKIVGDDQYSPQPFRMLGFQSAINELSINLRYVPVTLGNARTSWTPFVHSGLGAFTFDPKAKYDGQLVPLQPIGTEGQGAPGYAAPYRLSSWMIPLGAGMSVLLNDRFNITLGVSTRILPIDYLDDVSDAELDYFELLKEKGPIAASLSRPSFKEGDNPIYKRGGPFNDGYFVIYLGLSQVIDSGNRGSGGGLRARRAVGCPTF